MDFVELLLLMGATVLQPNVTVELWIKSKQGDEYTV